MHAVGGNLHTSFGCLTDPVSWRNTTGLVSDGKRESPGPSQTGSGNHNADTQNLREELAESQKHRLAGEEVISFPNNAGENVVLKYLFGYKPGLQRTWLPLSAVNTVRAALQSSPSGWRRNQGRVKLIGALSFHRAPYLHHGMACLSLSA